MIYIIVSLFLALVTLTIFSSKYYEIKLIKKRNACTIWEAIKIYAKTSENEEYELDDWSEDLFSDDDEEQRNSPIFSFLPGNIYHHRHYD